MNRRRPDQAVVHKGLCWLHFPHDADVGLIGRGGTRATAFEAIAMAMTGAVTDLQRVRPSEAVSVHCEAPSDELLLADWLNAIIFEMAVRNMLFSRFDISLDEHVLDATLWGEVVDRQRHRPAVEVKGATYTGLSLAETGEGWEARCVVDV